MIKRRAFVYYVAVKFADILPEKVPNYRTMDDADFISILSWCEDWEPEKVYKTAYKESHIDYIQTWDEWSNNMIPLPLVVRTELERAMKIHDVAGNLKAIRAFSFFYNNGRRMILWGGLSFLALWLLF
jgi:hypothetical protein